MFFFLLNTPHGRLELVEGELLCTGHGGSLGKSVILAGEGMYGAFVLVVGQARNNVNQRQRTTNEIRNLCTTLGQVELWSG